MSRKDRPISRDGGGVLLYVRSTLKPHEFHPASRFPEQVWCRIADSSGEDFYLGICYHTTTINIFGSGNNEELRDLLNEIELGGLKAHFILMGDLNYNFRKWPLQNDTGAPSAEAHHFCGMSGR